MVPDESMAYAIATWARFDAGVSDDLLRALAAAFALVAVADGELAKSEADEFVELLRSKSDVFSSVDFDALELVFRDLTDALIGDPEQGRVRACDCIARMKGDPAKCELVRSGAAIAVAADGHVRAPEQAAMQEICAALGLEP
ncbi:MAG: tellurite resistance TerB family protein [Deltaproteobacteria bacterium]|nr:tellurite resistance TerB family protein [Deltaproteobacteria bacterium]MBW2552461.1 tellurite resistance TerB family protein [Deltaproteobacteria bacterium]MBW2629194.1 tellurite resistance TerB family protein [Deltaproteobacteria bacterium]MBW2687190.1 tellurite resistance TerB family protein [Deltaproteobacteria bacterium]